MKSDKIRHKISDTKPVLERCSTCSAVFEISLCVCNRSSKTKLCINRVDSSSCLTRCQIWLNQAFGGLRLQSLVERKRSGDKAVERKLNLRD